MTPGWLHGGNYLFLGWLSVSLGLLLKTTLSVTLRICMNKIVKSQFPEPWENCRVEKVWTLEWEMGSDLYSGTSIMTLIKLPNHSDHEQSSSLVLTTLLHFWYTVNQWHNNEGGCLSRKGLVRGIWEVISRFWASRKPISWSWGWKLWNGKGGAQSGDPLGDWVPPLDNHGGEAWVNRTFPGLPAHPVTCQPALHSASQLVRTTWCVGHCSLPLPTEFYLPRAGFLFWMTHPFI